MDIWFSSWWVNITYCIYLFRLRNDDIKKKRFLYGRGWFLRNDTFTFRLVVLVMERFVYKRS